METLQNLKNQAIERETHLISSKILFIWLVSLSSIFFLVSLFYIFHPSENFTGIIIGDSSLLVFVAMGWGAGLQLKKVKKLRQELAAIENRQLYLNKISGQNKLGWVEDNKSKFLNFWEKDLENKTF